MKPGPEAAPRRAAFEADLALLRSAVVEWTWTGLIDRLPRLIFRRPPSTLSTPGQRLLLGLVALVQRMLLPVLVTTLTASWAEAPVWTWIGIAAVSAVYNTWLAALASESYLEDLMAMPAAIEHHSGVHDLVRFTQRWFGLRISIPIALTIAGIVLGAVAILAPAEFRAMHIGSVVMGAYFLYEYGEIVAMRIITMSLFIREARHPHRLSWFDPLDSPCIQTMITSARQAQLMGSVTVVVALGFSIALIGPQSFMAMLAPIAGLSIVMFVTDTFSVLAVHRSVRRIVGHSREATLERLRRRQLRGPSRGPHARGVPAFAGPPRDLHRGEGCPRRTERDVRSRNDHAGDHRGGLLPRRDGRSVCRASHQPVHSLREGQTLLTPSEQSYRSVEACRRPSSVG